MYVRRIIVICLTLFAAIVIAGCGSADIASNSNSPVPQPTEKPIDDRPKIIAFGDSLTSGFALKNRDDSYPSLLQKRLDEQGYNYQVLNFGQGGDRTDHGLARLHLATGIKASRIFIVELGINDAVQRIPVETVKSNLDEILTRILADGKKVLLCGVHAPADKGEEYVAAFDAMYLELAKKHNVKLYDDFMTGVAGVPDHLLPDGIHPNEAGARIIEQHIFEQLAPLLTKNEKGN
jgi:acyl-CoA thioesterase-1